MKCHECSKPYPMKNQNPEGSCTPPVLQINNEPEVVLFHRKDFPASLGDETTNPPQIGEYRNILLVYEATGTAYLFNSDGVPTLLTNKDAVTRLENLISEEAVTRARADELLRIITDEQGLVIQGKQNQLIAGTGISIVGNVISVDADYINSLIQQALAQSGQ